ncbi:MAG: DUF4129 domain-containing protein [Dehalococcoidia bacterium]|nr:DUF4129 domain-containing protein [Dehalococcoidia bacterium]
MTTTTWQSQRGRPSAAPNPPAPRSGWSALARPDETWLPFGLLFLMSLATVWAVEGAKWVPDMPGLTGITVASLAVGYVMAKLRVPSFMLHPLALIIGFLVVARASVDAAKGATLDGRLADAISRLNSFAVVIRDGGINVDTLPFIVQVLIFTWLTGYLSAWFFYRLHNAWLAMLPPGIALLVNLTYLPNNFTYNFVLFVVTAMALTMFSHTMQLQLRWKRTNVSRQELADLSLGGPLLALSGGLLAVTFFLPLFQQSLPIMVLFEQATGPWRGMEREFDRLFASVSSGKVAPLHSFGRSMPFRGAVNFGDQQSLAGRLGLARDVIMNIKTEESGYWHAESYDTFTGQGWIASDRKFAELPQDTVRGAVDEYRERRALQQTIETNIPIDLFFYRGMPIFGNTPAVGEMPPSGRFTLQLADLTANRGLRPDMQDLARTLSVNLRNTNRLVTPDELQRMIPSDMALERPIRRQGQIDAVILRRTDPFPPDYTSLRTRTPMNRGVTYSLTSSVTKASIEALEGSGTAYPGWALDQYLQLPDTTTERVRQRAREWSKDSRNPYDMAWAIESRLREIPYSTNIPAPPRDQDGVDYFLFTLNRGYADYYASALAVMLRSLGIPARVSVGYVSGDWDQDKEQYVVREAHAHAWTEVFFPNYGWIEFNPSPNWPTVPRTFENLGSGTIEDDFPEDIPGSSTEEPEQTPEEMAAAAAALEAQASSRLVEFFGFVAAALLAAWVAFRLAWMWDLRSLGFPAQTYEKMCRLARLARLQPRTVQTPYEYAQTLSRMLPNAQISVQMVAREYARARYSPQQQTAEELTRLRMAWAEIRWELTRKLLRFWEPRRNR